MNCPSCGDDNRDTAKFCLACGERFSLTCARCNADLPRGARFCDECGASVEETPAPAPESKPRDPTPKPLAEETVHPEPTMEGERRQLTVMFCDLVGSTRLASQLDPEDWREVVRQYQEACSGVVERFDGHVAQYLGDGVLVYFGYPFAHEDDAIRALHVAMRIRDEVLALNPRLAERLPLFAEHPLQVRIGVHTGAVVVGRVGAGEKQEQLALGETTHIAARLEALAEPGTVVLSGATRQLVRGAFLLEDLGEQSLEGVSRPVSVSRAIRTLGVQSRLDFGSGPLIGREQQMELLMERWQEAREGRGQVVLVSGEAGMGKSRLVQALREWVADQPHTLHEYHCSPYHQSSAFYPVAELIERVLVFTENDTPEERIEKLARGLHVSGLPVAETLPLIAPVLSLHATDAYPRPALSPEAQRRKSLEMLSAWCLSVADLQPLILIAEDLHWADPTTLELVGMMVEQAPTTSILVVMTFRPGLQAPWVSRSHMVHLTLHALSHRQARQMVEGLAGGKALPAQVMDEVVSKTDGVPLFVEELTKMVLESGLLRLRHGNYELVGPLPPLAIPTTLQDSLMARLDRLGTTKEVVQLGAVLGREFSHELLATVSSLDPEMLEGALDRLVGAELLYQRGVRPRATYTFKHTLIQEIAYQSLLKSMRQQYHARIAQALVERSPEMVESQPELLARHYTEAGLNDSAIRYCQLAGQRAVERSANLEAVRHLTRALELLSTLPKTRQRKQQELGIQTLLGVALIDVKGYAAEEVERALLRAHELCEELGDAPQRLPVLVGLFLFRMVRAEREATRDLVEPLLAFAGGTNDPGSLLEAHGAAGVAAFYEGRHEEAEKHWEQTFALYDPGQHGAHAFIYGQDPAVSAYTYSGLNLWLLGYPDQALERSARAIALAEQIGHPYSLAVALSQGAEHRLYRREIPKCYELSDRCISIAAEQSFPLWLGVATARRGWALVQLGDTEDGLAQTQEGLSIFRETGAKIDVPGVLSQLADALLKAGRAEEGLAAVDEALSLTETNLDRYFEPKLRTLRGELLLILSTPDYEGAERCFQRALEQSREYGARSLELRAAMSFARLWQRQGRKEEARELLAPVYDWFTEGFDTRDLRDARSLLDQLA